MDDKLDGIDPVHRKALEEFFTAFGVEFDIGLWKTLVEEEARELMCATDPTNRLKEACDYAYVLTGLLLSADKLNVDDDDLLPDTEYGYVLVSAASEMARAVVDDVGDMVFNEAFRRVHASNMSKLGPNGKPIYREDGKVLKGPNYKPPALDDLAIPSVAMASQYMN